MATSPPLDKCSLPTTNWNEKENSRDEIGFITPKQRNWARNRKQDKVNGVAHNKKNESENITDAAVKI